MDGDGSRTTALLDPFIGFGLFFGFTFGHRGRA